MVVVVVVVVVVVDVVDVVVVVGVVVVGVVVVGVVVVGVVVDVVDVVDVVVVSAEITSDEKEINPSLPRAKPIEPKMILALLFFDKSFQGFFFFFLSTINQMPYLNGETRAIYVITIPSSQLGLSP